LRFHRWRGPLLGQRRATYDWAMPGSFNAQARYFAAARSSGKIVHCPLHDNTQILVAVCEHRHDCAEVRGKPPSSPFGPYIVRRDKCQTTDIANRWLRKSQPNNLLKDLNICVARKLGGFQANYWEENIILLVVGLISLSFQPNLTLKRQF
jgi:hypothetical protein